MAEDDDFYENNPKTFNNDGEDDEETKGKNILFKALKKLSDPKSQFRRRRYQCS